MSYSNFIKDAFNNIDVGDTVIYTDINDCTFKGIIETLYPEHSGTAEIRLSNGDLKEVILDMCKKI